MIIVFAAIVFVVSMIMVLSKPLFKSLNRFFNKSYSIRRIFKVFDIKRSIDIFSFLNVKTVFVLVILCSSISLFYSFKYLGNNTLAIFLSNDANHVSFLQTIIDSFQLTIIFLLLSVIVISFLLFLSPKSFESVNAILNSWFSTRKAYKRLDVALNVDETLFKYQIHIGLLGMLTSVAITVTCWYAI